MPRIETTQTLSRGLGPAVPPAPGELTLDAALDTIAARQMLQRQAWALAWAEEDPRGHTQAIEELVRCAHAIARAAHGVPPGRRNQHWDEARALASTQPAAPGVPGARERALSRVALEWAAAAPAPASDGLFSLQPAGWIALRAGGPDELTECLLNAASNSVPCLRVNTDVDPAAAFVSVPKRGVVAVAVCDDFESEAQQCAACVLRHLQSGATPVAVIAQDRVLVRRVRALLARQGVSIRDETGWTLSTTRAAASVRSVLTAAQPDASTDDWLDWLKTCAWISGDASPDSLNAPAALDELELSLRTQKLRKARSVNAENLPAAAASLWRTARSALRPLGSLVAANGSAWLDALGGALKSSGQRAALNEDDAGRQVLAALRLHLEPPQAGMAFTTESMGMDEFLAWVDAVLEQATYLPQSPESASVVITPLARAMLRPFAATVFAGTDERHLGVAVLPPSLLSPNLSAALRVPDRHWIRDAELQAFAHALRLPNLTLLRRSAEDGESLAASPLLELLQLARLRTAPDTWAVAPDARILEPRVPTPTSRPEPSAPTLLPARLSASACETLRSCPYRFFALRLLKLSAPEELDADLEKREYGTWLHAVLQRFHSERAQPGSAEAEAQRLHNLATEIRVEQHLDEAEFLPYAATFSRLVPRYLDWLNQRDAAGAKWLDGELSLAALPVDWGAVAMHGVIDRVDVVDIDGTAVTQLIDYKTGQGQALRDAIRRGEDVQLPFYAALMAAQSHSADDMSAMYLMLDDPDKVQPIEHDNVQASAQELVQGIGRDLARLRAGAAMPALGEGRTCEFCEARGLCRRDDWPGLPDAAA